MATTTPSIKTFLFCGFIKISFSYFVISITSFVGSADSSECLDRNMQLNNYYNFFNQAFSVLIELYFGFAESS